MTTRDYFDRQYPGHSSAEFALFKSGYDVLLPTLTKVTAELQSFRKSSKTTGTQPKQTKQPSKINEYFYLACPVCYHDCLEVFVEVEGNKIDVCLEGVF